MHEPLELLPPALAERVRAAVEAGWFASEQDVVSEAVSHFLDTYRPDLQERFLREDLEWGLDGED